MSINKEIALNCHSSSEKVHKKGLQKVYRLCWTDLALIKEDTSTVQFEKTFLPISTHVGRSLVEVPLFQRLSLLASGAQGGL